MAQTTYSSGRDDLEELRKSVEKFHGEHPAASLQTACSGWHFEG
jgi:hypothetical protein